MRIALKRPFRDGTVAVDMDPLSLLCRLAAAVPPARQHTVRYAGVLAPAATLRPKVIPPPPDDAPEDDLEPAPAPLPTDGHRCRYRPWAELLRRTFAIDLEICALQWPHQDHRAATKITQRAPRVPGGLGSPGA